MTDNLELNMDAYLPLRDVVFHTLREAILKGELKPGERLMELQLASKLGVSRTPIREAIRMLEQEGLAVTIPRKGAEVAKMTEKDMEDVLQIREVLDELAVSLACDNISAEEMQELERNMIRFENSIKSGDLKSLAQTDVEFHDVDFGYTPEKTVLHDIKLYAKPGQKVAFVGATGAGKTTITNLINRFYDIQDGKIRYDGININKIKKDDLRHSLGIVLQDTHLFTGTVMENIRYGKLDATDAEVIAAAKLANADSFIRHLPEGYQTKLTGDGASLSQGQRQLLAIARAAVADPPVLILDEATSSIDTRTERIVQEGMDRLMKGRTTFVIAHRLSTVRNSDCIIVLEQGRVIERGNHDQLMAEKGKYYQLYTGNTASH